MDDPKGDYMRAVSALTALKEVLAEVERLHAAAEAEVERAHRALAEELYPAATG